MANHFYERLSAMDSSFLAFEDAETHMHVGGISVFEAGPIGTADGGVDVERMRAYVESRLALIPRYRQRLAHVPLTGQPVWVDDDHFNLLYHVRHTRVPKPGDERQLKRLIAWILSHQLDRTKPLWEMWIVEGLAGGRFALIIKAHHCMVDGAAGVTLLSALLKADTDETIDEPKPWIPRPAPRAEDLLRDELVRRVRVPFALARRLGAALGEPEQALAEVEETARAVLKTLEAGLGGVAETPLNQPIGQHRRFDWLALDLATAKRVKNRLGGTVNDVVLATVSGAVGRFLIGRGTDVRKLDFRATVPVSVRESGDRALGNRLSAWIAPLPIAEQDPTRRLARVREITAGLRGSEQARGTETLIGLGDYLGTGFVHLGTRVASFLHPYNMIVSNVPGPQFPLYLLGARMAEGYPVVPLFAAQALGLAVFSYDGRLCWGFNADWDLVPDLHRFVEHVEASFRELERAAGESSAARPARRRPAARRRAG